MSDDDGGGADGGGRLTPGVVRVGETIRRPALNWPHLAQELLEHFERVEFSGAPRYLGRDEQGRVILSYVPGDVPTQFRLFEDEQVAAAASLLRDFHVATRTMSLVGGAVVCHNDPGPNNVVFQNNGPVAFIDFDMIAPGNPLEDIGYMAWTWCVSSKANRGPVDRQAAQVRLLADAYGLDQTGRDKVFDAVVDRQKRNSRFWSLARLEPKGMLASVEQIDDRIAWSERERTFTEAHRRTFADAMR